MEGLGNPFVLQPEAFRPTPSRAEANHTPEERHQTERALEEYFAAKDEGRLCAPDAYDLLFREGLLDERVDDGR